MATLETILNIKVEGTDQMVKLKTEIDKTSAELKELQKEGVKAGQTQDQYNAKVITAETKLKGLRGELNKGKTELVKNAKAAGDTSKSYNSLVKANAKLSQEARKLSDPLNKNKKAFGELTAKMKANEAQLKKMDKSMGRNQRNVGNYKQALTSVATGIGAVIIAFKAFERVLSTFVDFEFQMKQVGVISGATEAELAMLTETAKKLGSTTAFTAGEVAELQNELAKLGFDPTEIDNMTASVLDLAFAFDEDLATTGQTIAVVLNSYKLEASEAARVTDILAASFASTSLDLTKFNVAFPKVGAIAKQLGFSLEGTTAILGSLTNAGIEASTAGTSLRSIFLKLADSNSALSQRLGGSATSIETLLPALKELSEDGTDVNEMLGLTDKRSVTAFATLVSGIPDVQKLTKEFENSAGTAEKFANVMRDTLKGSLDEAKSAAGGFVIELFEALAPAIDLIVQGVGLLFTGLSFLITNFKAVAIGAAAYGVVVIGNAFATGALTTALIAEKIALAAVAVGNYIAATATRVFSAAIFANPIGLFVGLLTTGIALLFDWGDASGDAADKQDKATESLEETAKELTKLEKIQKKYNDKQIDEISTLKLLKKEISDTNLTLSERQEALKAFNKLTGSNIIQLKDEKRLTSELNNAMEGTIDALKRKIILDGSREKINVLLKDQLILDEKIEASIEKQNEKLKGNEAISKELALLEQERKNAGIRSSDQLLEDGLKLGKQNERAVSDAREFNNVIIAGAKEQAQAMAERKQNNVEITYANQLQIQDAAALISLDNMLKENELKTIEDKKTANEDLAVSEAASAENILKLRRQIGNVLQDNYETSQEDNILIAESEVIEKQVNSIYNAREKALSKLIKVTIKGSKSTTKAKTAYQLLAGEVTIYEAVLKKSVTEGANQARIFINSEEAKAMSVEDRNKRIAEIEEGTAKKVKIATGLVIKAKGDLKVVDDELAKQYEIINFESNEYINSLKKLAVESQKNIDLDKRQLGVLQELETAGADVANERIRLALKIAQTELDLAIRTAEASDITTEAQIANLRRLKGEIDGFKEQLENDDEDGGGSWLDKTLFGTNEDGGAFTMGDALTSIQIGLGAVSDVMSSFNEKSKQETDNKIGVIQKASDLEVKTYEESAQYQIDTDEERTTKIEAIEKKHDDEMLILKIAQFEKDKKFQKAQAVIGGATAIMNILKGSATGNVIADAIIKGVLIAATIATTAMQISTINSQPVPTAALGGIMDDSFFADGGMVVGKSHANGGEKFKVGGRVAELEGGEAVINKRSTAMFKPMLSKMNVAGGGKKFADGGMVFADGGMTFDTDSMQDESIIAESLVDQLNNQQVLLVEANVTQSQNSVKTIQSRVSF